MRTLLTILIIAAVVYTGLHCLGFMVGLFVGLLGLIVGIIGGVAGVFGSIMALIIGIGVGIFGAILPFLVMVLVIAGVVHLFKAA